MPSQMLATDVVDRERLLMRTAFTPDVLDPIPSSREEGARVRRSAWIDRRPRSEWLWSLVTRRGALIFAVGGILAFVVAGLPVTDLNAAQARAGAASLDVGATYWFSWFGGNVPGRYSLLMPTASHLLGVRVLAVLAVLAIVVLLPYLLHGTERPVMAVYFAIAAALKNLWSGRMAFCVGTALGVAAALALCRQMPWSAGLLNFVAALVSGLPVVFVLLATSGYILTGQLRPARIWPFVTLSVAGLALPVLLFGNPGPLVFDPWTLIRILIIVGCALAVRPPPPIRYMLLVTVFGCLTLYLIPTGIGNNMNRFACYVVPPMIWAVSKNRRRVVACAVLPAVLYSAWMLGADTYKAAQPSARSSYSAALVRELETLPQILDHRVEVIDTPTHRPSMDLAEHFFLARGWESQSDAAANPLMYDGTLTAATYRQWLSDLAVGWVAVPDHPNSANLNEVALIADRLEYLRETWHDDHWTLYAVRDPQPIVSPPATVTSRSPSQLQIAVPGPTTTAIRIRPSPYLQVMPTDGSGPTGTIQRIDESSIRVHLPRAGSYRISGRFDLAGLRSRVPPR
jgi:hypothetical protein